MEPKFSIFPRLFGVPNSLSITAAIIGGALLRGITYANLSTVVNIGVALLKSQIAGADGVELVSEICEMRFFRISIGSNDCEIDEEIIEFSQFCSQGFGLTWYFACLFFQAVFIDLFKFCLHSR